MGEYVVYVHQNKLNQKRYIGITNNTTKRWYGKGKHYDGCSYFYSAIQKYGWDNFYHVVIVRGLTLEEADVLERFFIRQYRTNEKAYGYNLTKGGQNAPTMLGKHHSEETKRKIGKAHRGRKHTEKQNREHSDCMKGMLVGSRNGKSTAVRCITTNEVFETQRQAAKAKNVDQSKISLCCQGKRNHTHGLKWEYMEA